MVITRILILLYLSLLSIKTIQFKMKFTFNLQQPLSQKPLPTQMRSHSDNIKSVVEIESGERFAKAIKLGYTFCPSVFNGKRLNSNWVSSPGVFLDFDGGITISQFTERLKDLKLNYSVIYTTFSSSNEVEKFRVGFIFDNPIEDLELRNRIVDQLLVLFSEADHKCSDPARLFFGTNKDAKVYLGNWNLSLLDFVSTLNSLVKPAERVTLREIKKPINNNSKDYKHALYSHILNLTNQKYSPIDGQLHNYSIRFFGFCNRFGLDLFDAIAFADSIIPSTHNEARAKDIYKRYSFQFGTYNFTPYNLDLN